MKLIPSICGLFIALRRTNGQNMTFMTTDDMFPMTTDMDTSTTMYTTDVIVSAADLVPDSDPFDDTCLFGLSSAVTLLDGEDSYVDICGTSMDDRVLINVEVTIPADKWAAVGFQAVSDHDHSHTDAATTSLMSGYAVVIPIYSRDLIEIYMDGPVYAGTAPGEVLGSSVTVISDMITDSLRTITFQRYATVEYGDLEENAANLLNVNDGKYFDFAGIQECDAEATVIYAFGPQDGKRFSSYPYHGNDNRGSVTMTIDTVDGEECDINFDSANQYMIMATFIISIIAILLS